MKTSRSLNWDGLIELAAAVLQLAVKDMTDSNWRHGFQREAAVLWLFDDTDSDGTPALWLAVCGIEPSAFRDMAKKVKRDSEPAIQANAAHIKRALAAATSGGKAT